MIKIHHNTICLRVMEWCVNASDSKLLVQLGPHETRYEDVLASGNFLEKALERALTKEGKV